MIFDKSYKFLFERILISFFLAAEIVYALKKTVDKFPLFIKFNRKVLNSIFIFVYFFIDLLYVFSLSCYFTVALCFYGL